MLWYRLFFSLMLVVQVAVVIFASSQQSLFDISAEVTSNSWFQTTLSDLYWALFAFISWVFYKESSWLSRIIWLLLVCGLGSIAIAGYALLQSRGADSLETVLLKKKTT